MAVYSKDKLSGKLNGEFSAAEPVNDKWSDRPQAEVSEPSEAGFRGGYNEGDLIRNLQRLVRKLEDLERQQAMDRKVIEQALEKVQNLGEKQYSEPTDFLEIPVLLNSLTKWLRIAQTSAKIVDNLAGNLILVADTMNHTLGEESDTEELDLSSVLRTIAELLQNLTPEKTSGSL